MKGGQKGKGLQRLAAAFAAAVLLLLPSCESMPQTAVSQPSVTSVSSPPVSTAEAATQTGGGDAGQTEAVPDSTESPAVRYRMEEYHVSRETLEIAVSYPQMEGEGREELNGMLRERALQTAQLLEQEEAQREAAQSQADAASEAVSPAPGSEAPVSSEAESRMVILMGGSQCYLPTDDFFSVAFTMDISDSTQQTPSKEWYAFNCDLRSGEEVTCADLFADLDGLANALRTQMEQDGAEESVLTYLTADRLRAGLPGVPVAFGSGFAEFGYPVPRAVGGVITVSLPLHVAASYRSDNTLWEAIGIS